MSTYRPGEVKRKQQSILFFFFLTFGLISSVFHQVDTRNLGTNVGMLKLKSKICVF